MQVTGVQYRQVIQEKNLSDPFCQLVSRGWVVVWILDVISALGSRSASGLSRCEEARAGKFHFARDRALYRSSHLLKRWVHAAILGCEPETLTYRYDDFGKPHLLGLEDLAFSLSHGGNFAAVAVSLVGNCGVDVEEQSAVTSAALPWPDLLHAREQKRFSCLQKPPPRQALTLWTLKEAASKVIGLGLSLPPRNIETPAMSCGMRYPEISPDLVVHGNYFCSMVVSILSLACRQSKPHMVAVASLKPVRGFIFQHISTDSSTGRRDRCVFRTPGKPQIYGEAHIIPSSETYRRDTSIHRGCYE